MEAVLDATATATTTTDVPPSGVTTPPVAITLPVVEPAAPARPTSFRDAFKQLDAKAKDAPAVSSVPATRAQAGASTTPVAGEPPKETWPTILQNARTKERELVTAEINQQIGWAREVPRETIEEVSRFARRMVSDPIGFLSEYVASLQQHPTHGALLRTEAARILSTLGGNGQSGSAEPQPDVELVNEQGQVTGKTFSADAQMKRDAWMRAQVLADVRREYGQLKADREREQTAAFVREQQRDLNARADVVLTDVLDILDGDKALAADVNQAMAEHPKWSAHTAALHVRKTKIAPLIDQKAHEKALNTMKHKAAGNTATPSGTVAAPGRPKTRQELAAYLANLPAS